MHSYSFCSFGKSEIQSPLLGTQQSSYDRYIHKKWKTVLHNMYRDYHEITSYSSWAEMTYSKIISNGLCLVLFIFIRTKQASCPVFWDHRERRCDLGSLSSSTSPLPTCPFLINISSAPQTTPVSFFATYSPSWCWWWTCPGGLEHVHMRVRAFQTPMNTLISTGLDYLTVQCCFMPSLDDSLAAHPSPHHKSSSLQSPTF